MHCTGLLTMLAVGASVAAASGTVVYTAKMTRIMTVTHCADSYADCPLGKTAAATTPAASSSSAAQTSVAKTSVEETPVETSIAAQVPTITLASAHSTVSGAPSGLIPGASTTGPLLVPTGAAGGLRVRNGAAAVAVAAVVAMIY
ncbi:hypothetical protein E4U41_006176 [Claviceps citrina]|nr:hypothetical protein E4U41_006176 [Claviceps citrina]